MVNTLGIGSRQSESQNWIDIVLREPEASAMIFGYDKARSRTPARLRHDGRGAPLYNRSGSRGRDEKKTIWIRRNPLKTPDSDE
jgi:hypothetical protein